MAPTPSLHSNYLDCNHVTRVVRIGGMSKPELIDDLKNHRIELNEAGRSLFANDGFTTSEVPSHVETVEITVLNLGYAQGAAIADISKRAISLGLSLCPLELGPHFRLQYLDQPEGQNGRPVTQHKAPLGSITIVSAPISEDEDTPKGFYLRRINDVLWLRGYRSEPNHIWSPEDHLVFSIRIRNGKQEIPIQNHGMKSPYYDRIERTSLGRSPLIPGLYRPKTTYALNTAQDIGDAKKNDRQVHE